MYTEELIKVNFFQRFFNKKLKFIKHELQDEFNEKKPIDNNFDKLLDENCGFGDGVIKKFNIEYQENGNFKVFLQIEHYYYIAKIELYGVKAFNLSETGSHHNLSSHFIIKDGLKLEKCNNMWIFNFEDCSLDDSNFIIEFEYGYWCVSKDKRLANRMGQLEKYHD